MELCVRCPAGTLRRHVWDEDLVVACDIIVAEHLKHESNYEHWEIHPSNCEGDKFLECEVWRSECDKGWREKIGSGKRYSDIKQFERIKA